MEIVSILNLLSIPLFGVLNISFLKIIILIWINLNIDIIVDQNWTLKRDAIRELYPLVFFFLVSKPKKKYHFKILR